ncbi:UDPGP type 1 family protein [Thalassoglobus sp. JC818]|uniref:UDPGP type 1 family protein n=1 Tax=Thalassoglobus sp. JC818 TaxID=3232136 RepID=UPI00345AA324
METPETIVSKLRSYDQEHLLKFWNELSEQQQQQLLKQIESIDFDLIASLIKQRDESQGETVSVGRIERAQSPAQLVRLSDSPESQEAWKKAEKRGNELLEQGKVGAILVAGGQGSRLGFDDPKGMFPIGPVSGRTLFQVMCEQLVARSRRHGKPIPYFIMTSEATHEPTVEFFKKNNFFGMGEENVFFFQQSSLPAVEHDSSRIHLAEKGRVATSPDGHGGMLRALDKHELLQVMRDRGIEHLYYHQVDNPTAILCDPVMLGFHDLHESDLTTKVVEKVSPDEKMGVLVTIDGQTEIIEYSDLTPEQARMKDEDGNYVFWAGNTAIHVFRRTFIERLLEDEFSLPFHIAHKKVPCVDSSGEPVDPDTPNAHKFEQFIFDALPKAKVALVVEGVRSREFNPVKNAEGNDSPESSRKALQEITRNWVEKAGGKVNSGATVEVSPLFALDENELASKVDPGREFHEDTVLAPQ